MLITIPAALGFEESEMRIHGKHLLSTGNAHLKFSVSDKTIIVNVTGRI